MYSQRSKSRFKVRGLEFFREVERTGQCIVIADHGRPVRRLVSQREEPAAVLRRYRATLAPADERLR